LLTFIGDQSQGVLLLLNVSGKRTPYGETGVKVSMYQPQRNTIPLLAGNYCKWVQISAITRTSLNSWKTLRGLKHIIFRQFCSQCLDYPQPPIKGRNLTFVKICAGNTCLSSAPGDQSCAQVTNPWYFSPIIDLLTQVNSAVLKP